MKPCNSCACTVCNKGKPNPEISGDIQWYSQENIDRLWKSAQEMPDFLICHSTDSVVESNGGNKNIKKGKEKACIGFVTWVFMHIKIYEFVGCSFSKYRNAVGHKVAIPQKVMAEFALSIAIKRSSLIGGMQIPDTLEGEIEDLVFPTGFERTIAKFKEAIKQS